MCTRLACHRQRDRPPPRSAHATRRPGACAQWRQWPSVDPGAAPGVRVRLSSVRACARRAAWLRLSAAGARPVTSRGAYAATYNARRRFQTAGQQSRKPVAPEASPAKRAGSSTVRKNGLPVYSQVGANRRFAPTEGEDEPGCCVPVALLIPLSRSSDGDCRPANDQTLRVSKTRRVWCFSHLKFTRLSHGLRSS